VRAAQLHSNIDASGVSETATASSMPANLSHLFFGTGKLVDLKDTISGFKGILDGKHDSLPEQVQSHISPWWATPPGLTLHTGCVQKRCQMEDTCPPPGGRGGGGWESSLTRVHLTALCMLWKALMP